MSLLPKHVPVCKHVYVSAYVSAPTYRCSPIILDDRCITRPHKHEHGECCDIQGPATALQCSLNMYHVSRALFF